MARNERLNIAALVDSKAVVGERLPVAADRIEADRPIVTPRPVLNAGTHRPATLNSKRTESLLSATRADSMFKASTSTWS